MKRKNVSIIIVILIIIILVAIVMSSKQDDIPPAKFDGNKIPLHGAWIVQTKGGGDRNFQGQEILKNVTENLINISSGYITLHEKNVPTDIVDRENLYAAFEAEDFGGYYIFMITPGNTLGYATGEININYIGMRKEQDGTLFLDLKYKSNKAFDIKILYSKNPRMTKVPIVLPDHKISFRDVFEAYPIDNNLISVNAKAESTGSWKSISFKLDDSNFNPNNKSDPEKYIWIPHLKYESKRIDLAQSFLEELDGNFEDENLSKYQWDEKKITKENISKIVNEFKSRGHKIVNIYLNKIKVGENVPPTIKQGIVLCGTICYNDEIMITVGE